jgi:hypothetical protein
VAASGLVGLNGQPIRSRPKLRVLATLFIREPRTYVFETYGRPSPLAVARGCVP